MIVFEPSYFTFLNMLKVKQFLIITRSSNYLILMSVSTHGNICISVSQLYHIRHFHMIFCCCGFRFIFFRVTVVEKKNEKFSYLIQAENPDTIQSSGSMPIQAENPDHKQSYDFGLIICPYYLCALTVFISFNLQTV